MFRAIAPHQLVNDAGIEISRKDRYAMEYRDGDHVLALYCDPVASDDGRFGAAICLPHDACWQPPFEHERIECMAWKHPPASECHGTTDHYGEGSGN